MKTKLLFLSLCLCSTFLFSQTVLNSNGIGNTYEELNAFFAPGYTAVETSDQTGGTTTGSHIAFGRHIDEVMDASAGKFVYRFFSHINEDNDVSTTSTDRIRVEIKTYAPSPANMKATLGETVTYKWRFKLPTGFVPSTSFTHIHQIKAVDGDDGDPIFTLTPRKGTGGNPNKLELVYDENAAASASDIASADLSLFENVWVEVTETIFYSTTTGAITLNIKRVSDNASLLSYTNTNIATFRPDNTFVRPKWGIYRRIANSSGVPITGLRDEVVLFSDFSVTEGVLASNSFSTEFTGLKTNVIENYLEFILPNNEQNEFKIYNTIGSEVKAFAVKGNQNVAVEELAAGTYLLKSKEGQTTRFIKK